MRPSLRWVLLRHETPIAGAGAWHFDWLIERFAPGPGSTPDSRDLIAFRVPIRPDDPAATGFVALRLPDHRRLYLEYEGPLTGGRGRVSRIASGHCLASGEADGTLVVTLVSPETGLDRIQREWIGRREDDRSRTELPAWSFRLAAGG